MRPLPYLNSSKNVDCLVELACVGLVDHGLRSVKVDLHTATGLHVLGAIGVGEEIGLAEAPSALDLRAGQAASVHQLSRHRVGTSV